MEESCGSKPLASVEQCQTYNGSLVASSFGDSSLASGDHHHVQSLIPSIIASYKSFVNHAALDRKAKRFSTEALLHARLFQAHANMSSRSNDILIELVEDEEDFEGFFECMFQSFGIQTNDAFFITLHPTMYTKEGYASSVKRLQEEWRNGGKNDNNKFWLKATVPDNEAVSDTSTNSRRKIAGVAIWVEALQSRNPPSNDVTQHMDLEKLYPNNEPEQRFLKQTYASLFGHRVEVVKAAGQKGHPVMVLDLCATHPAYQRRGIAKKLVQWGLDLASKQGELYGRGTLECYTEGSVMGRAVYERMGFQAEGEVVFVVDDEFKDRRTAPNTQLRRPHGMPV